MIKRLKHLQENFPQRRHAFADKHRSSARGKKDIHLLEKSMPGILIVYDFLILIGKRNWKKEE